MLNVIKKILKRIPKMVVLFLFGGILYTTIEMLFRGFTHPSMFVVGGLCFILIGKINEYYPWEMPLISQMFISSIIVTVIEFVAGLILNVWLKIGVWNYSDLPYNLCGQICLIFSVAWFFVSIVGIVMDDVCRWLIYKEEKPRYHIFYVKR